MCMLYNDNSNNKGNISFPKKATARVNILVVNIFSTQPFIVITLTPPFIFCLFG